MTRGAVAAGGRPAGGSTLFLATTGGHLGELYRLASRIYPMHSPVWATHSNEQSRTLLAGHDVEFVPFVGVRNLKDVARSIPIARRLMDKWRFTRAISTGSGIALGYLPYLAMRGVECHYVESATRTRGPSLTGRILRWVPGIRTYTQHRSWATRKWHYAGGVFDAYRARRTEPNSTRSVISVVVTTGVATQFPFRRLVEHLVPLLAPEGPLAAATGRGVEVLWQIGGTRVDDLPIATVSALPTNEFRAALARADIVISHAGMGSVLDIFDAGRLPILAVRESGRGEQIDDHQQQLAAELADRGLAVSRSPTQITVEDMLEVLQMSVTTVGSPPPLLLRRGERSYG